MANEHPTDVDEAMHRALSTCLPDREPPIGLRVEDVVRLGRRRGRIRRAGPVAAAAVTVLVVAVSWTLAAGGPEQPATPPPPPPSPTASAPPTSESTSPGVSDYRMPAGHRWETNAQTLAKSIAERLPPEHVAGYVGSASEQLAGERYGFGFHTLWRDGDRFGYLIWLHRTKGEFPATAYGLPVEPCVEPAGQSPAFNCTRLQAPADSIAYGFEVDSGYRMRGIVWDGKDPASGPDIRVTIAFYLPNEGGWTPFPIMDTHPTLESIPMSVDELARLIGMREGN